MSREEEKRKSKDRRILYAIVISLVLIFGILGVGAYLSLSSNLKSEGTGGIICAAIVFGIGLLLFEFLMKWAPIRSYERIRAEEEKERKREEGKERYKSRS